MTVLGKAKKLEEIEGFLRAEHGDDAVIMLVVSGDGDTDKDFLRWARENGYMAIGTVPDPTDTRAIHRLVDNQSVNRVATPNYLPGELMDRYARQAVDEAIIRSAMNTSQLADRRTQWSRPAKFVKNSITKLRESFSKRMRGI